MSNIDKAVELMIDSVRNSKEYLEMVAAREKLEKEPELCATVDDFRGRNYAIQTGTDCDIEVLERLEAEFKDVREKPVAAEFLAKELAFCRMVQAIMTEIYSSVNFV